MLTRLIRRTRLIRSHRAEAMDASLDAIAADLERMYAGPVVIAPFPQVLAAVSAQDSPAHETRSRPRNASSLRRLVAAGAVTAVVFVGGVAAAATDVIPNSVIERFELTSRLEPGLRASIDDAQLHSTYAGANGRVYELWVAPAADGGCMTIVELVDDDDSNELVICGSSTFGTVIPSFINYGVWTLGDAVAVHGSTPDDIVEIAITFPDGTTVKAPVTNNEFFTVIDRTCGINPPDTCEVTVTGYDANGRISTPSYP